MGYVDLNHEIKLAEKMCIRNFGGLVLDDLRDVHTMSFMYIANLFDVDCISFYEYHAVYVYSISFHYFVIFIYFTPLLRTILILF